MYKLVYMKERYYFLLFFCFSIKINDFWMSGHYFYSLVNTRACISILNQAREKQMVLVKKFLAGKNKKVNFIQLSLDLADFKKCFSPSVIANICGRI